MTDMLSLRAERARIFRSLGDLGCLALALGLGRWLFPAEWRRLRELDKALEPPR